MLASLSQIKHCPLSCGMPQQQQTGVLRRVAAPPMHPNPLSAWLSSSVAAMHALYAQVTSMPAVPASECCQFVTVQALVPTLLSEQAAAFCPPLNPHHRPAGQPSCPNKHSAGPKQTLSWAKPS